MRCLLISQVVGLITRSYVIEVRSDLTRSYANEATSNLTRSYANEVTSNLPGRTSLKWRLIYQVVRLIYCLLIIRMITLRKYM